MRVRFIVPLPLPVPNPVTFVVQLIWPDEQLLNVKFNVPHACCVTFAATKFGGNWPFRPRAAVIVAVLPVIGPTP